MLIYYGLLWSLAMVGLDVVYVTIVMVANVCCYGLRCRSNGNIVVLRSVIRLMIPYLSIICGNVCDLLLEM